MLLVSILLIVLVLLSTSMLGNARGAGSRPVYRWIALAALGQATLFFGLAIFLPADPIDAWGFQQFYGAFCVLTVVAASVFIQKEYRAIGEPDTAGNSRKPAARITSKPASEPAGRRVDGRP